MARIWSLTCSIVASVDSEVASLLATKQAQLLQDEMDASDFLLDHPHGLPDFNPDGDHLPLTGNTTNATIPCGMPSWSHAGIDELTAQDSLSEFGNPVVGSPVNVSNVANLDGAIQYGFVDCLFGPVLYGHKCTGKVKELPHSTTLQECGEASRAEKCVLFSWQARTGKCKLVFRETKCLSLPDDSWNTYETPVQVWHTSSPGDSCTRKKKFQIKVVSIIDCQERAIAAGVTTFAFFEGKLLCQIPDTYNCKPRPKYGWNIHSV